MTTTKVLVTGASGLLGRAVLRELQNYVDQFKVIGVARTRFDESKGIFKLDLTDENAVDQFIISQHQPDVIVHCAAERQPDICRNKPEQAKKINVDATEYIAKAAQKLGKTWCIYISTDYVFDGTNPPYYPSSAPNPLNEYGVSKYEGEKIILKYNSSSSSSISSISSSGEPARPKNLVLRIPFLYGEVESLDESPVTVLAKAYLKKARSNHDHYQRRFPTLVDDVAVVIRQIIEMQEEVHRACPTCILHWSGNEEYTKYTITRLIADILEIPKSEFDVDELLVPVLEPPKDATSRPKDSRLDCSDLEKLGIGRKTPFKEALTKVLTPWKAQILQSLYQQQ